MTDATSTIIAAVIAGAVGFVTALITTHYSVRNLKLEMRAKYRSELAKRQIEACEAFWVIFGPTSMTDGVHRIITGFATEPMLNIQETEAFIAKFQETFTSKAGLYLSKPTRAALHEFRNMLVELKNEAPEASEKYTLTREQADKVKALRTKARLALREEVGSTDLTVANTEYWSY